MKYLIWMVVALVVVFWVVRANRISARPGTGSGPGTGTGAAASGGNMPGEAARRAESGAETMLECAHCGVHVPASEAVIVRPGAAFCSSEHRALHGSR
jgi:uncharacterized protein